MRARRLHQRGGAEDGFTLIEVLVAITILALLVSLMVASLRLVSDSWIRVQQASQRTDDVATTEALLRRLITQAYPAVIRLNDNRYRISFDGHADTLEFTTTLPPIGAVGGFHRVALYLQQGKLVLSHRVERNETDGVSDTAGFETIDMLDGVTRLQFAYYGPAEDGQPPGWQDSWLDRTSLPRLVRIELRRSGEVFPPLVIAPQIDVDATCVFDVLTRRCKGR